MSDESGVPVPQSFLALYMEPGRVKPRASHAQIAERHEFCEDLAQLLAQRAGEIRADLGITRQDVLERMRRGLFGDDSGVEVHEAQWVWTRLIELLGWSP